MLGGVLGAWQNAARRAGSLDLLSKTIQAPILPPAGWLNNLADGIADFNQGLWNAPKLVRENRELRQRAQSVELYVANEKKLLAQLDQARRTMNLPDVPGRTKIFVDIVAYFPSENRLTISAGLDKKITKGLPVLAADGLVGVIQTIEAKTAQVLLIHSPTLKLGASVRRNPPVAGLIRGYDAHTLILDYLSDKAPIEPGDWVDTSGFSDRIPAGIPIGRILQVDDEPDFGSRKARIYPTVKVGELRELIVLK